jgi:hypothetical protein
MFTIDEKSTLITALTTRRNIIETSNPYLSANDAFRRIALGITVKIKAKPRALSETEVEEIIKINKLITKTQTLP